MQVKSCKRNDLNKMRLDEWSRDEWSRDESSQRFSAATPFRAINLSGVMELIIGFNGRTIGFKF
jgi:hypothetical protein